MSETVILLSSVLSVELGWTVETLTLSYLAYAGLRSLELEETADSLLSLFSNEILEVPCSGLYLSTAHVNVMECWQKNVLGLKFPKQP